MKKAKRALALALVFALVASFCVTGAAADGGQKEQSPEELDYVKNGKAVTTDDDVTVSKKAEYVGENEYNITLEVTIPDAQVTVGSSADIVLVIDTSGSMNYCADCGEENYHDSGCSHYWDNYWGYGSPVQYDERRLYAAQESAKSFVDQLLDEGEGVNARIGIVSYETTADVACELSKNAYEIEGEIDDLYANGGTNIQAGIHEARQMLQNSTAANKYIVVLSDGEPTYSYPVKGTSGWRGCDDDYWGHDWNDDDGYGRGEPANINLPSADEVTENAFDYDAEYPTGSGSSYDSGVYALLDVTCRHDLTMYDYEYTGNERTFDNNGDPAIAEAGFAKADDCTIYSIYFGTPSVDAEHTMLGISNGVEYYGSAEDGEALQGIFDSIAGDVIETSAGAVTDPMGEYITLGDVENLAGVTRTETGLTWDPTKSQGQPVEGGTKYTVTYPIKVDGEKLTASGWVYANGTTTFSYKVNGELKTVDFNVPQVWGEKVETETPQDVYVYVRVVNDDESPLTDEQISQIRGWGLTTLNDSGYYTIGEVKGCLLPPAAENQGENVYGLYGERVNLSDIERYGANRQFDITGVKWYDLKVADGANDYVQSGTDCWHLDGKITLEQLEQRLVTVTYDKNAEDATGTMEPQSVIKGFDVTLRENGFTNPGYEFTGWNTQKDGNGTAYQPNETFEIEENTTLYAQWEKITGTLTVTKTVEGLEGNDTLPDAFTITVTGTSGAADGDSYTLTIGVSGDENIKYSYDEASGTHQWVISGAALGNYSVSESNTQVIGYKLDTSASTQSDTMTLTDTATSDSAELKNVYVKDNPGLGVEKTVYSVGDATGADIPSEVKVGDVIVYKIVVTNTGNVALEKISVTDTLDGLSLTVYTDADCKTEAATFDLAVDETKELYATYTVQAADAGKKLTNTATAEAEDGTEGSGDVPVEVKKQYTLKINYHYDEVSGEPFKTEEHTLNEGDSWSVSTETTDATHVAPKTVTRVLDGANVNYMLDTSLPQSGTISDDVTIDLVYVKDEWKDDDPDGDSETGGDGTPDYQQALIKYKAKTGGTVDPAINVETLTDEDGDGKYSGEVKAESTATAGEGYVFDGWTGPDGYTSVEAKLSHGFTAVGGETYIYTARFKTGTTDAEVTKTLVSYTRDGVTVDEIPADFKARVGDVLNYTITVKNTGEVALNTTVRDTIDGKGTLTINPGTGYTVEDGVITITNLAPNDTVTISASYTVVEGDIGRTITNTATVDMGDEVPGDDPKDDEEVEVDDYSVTITPADIVAYTGGDGYSAVVGANDQYINNSESGLPEPGYHVVLSDAVVDWLNDNGVAAGDGLTDDATDLADVLSFTYSYGGEEREWSLQYVGVYSYNASGNPSAYVYSIVTETAGAPSVSLKYFDDLNEDGEADDNEVITSDDILMSAGQVNHTYKMTIEGGDLDQSQVKAVLKAGESSLTTDIEIGIGELTVLSTTNEETTNSIAGNAAGVDSGVITAVGSDSITYYVNESGVAFDEGDLVSRVQLLIDEVTNETSGEFETAMAEAAFDAISADLRNAEYEMCYMDLVDTENGNAKVTFSGGELSIYWPLPDGASASDSFYIVHFTELDREHAAVGTDVLDTTNKDVIAGEVMRIGGEYYVTFDVGSFSPFVLVYGDEGGDGPWWPPIGPGDDDDDGDDDVDREFVPKWLNIDDHYAYIIGYEDGTVRPQGNITRAEVATIFFRLLTDEVREEYWSTESGYSDVSSSDWYNNAISTLSNLGVITGYEDGTFRPNASISRAEFVTIATRFFDYTAEYEGTFSDVSYSSWYADFVQAAVDMGLVNGYENGTFRPNASITRAEAVAIVNRVLLRRPDADHLLPWSVMNTFSDNVLESAWYYEDIQEATNSHDYDWITYSGERIEDWTEKLEERDWAALEREWSKAYDAPGGEVTA